MRRIKVAMIPAKADPVAQKKYEEEVMKPRLEEAKQGKRTVYFVDSAHFVLTAFLGFLWAFGLVFIKAPPGRQRFNVLGALNAITHELISVTNDTYISSQSVCELLHKLCAQNIGLPITLFLDNARYQHCKLVIETAARLNIELCFLPTYSPNLNLIERLWKFVKKECLYSKYYENFDLFKSSISKCLSETSTTHKTRLDSLLALRFHIHGKGESNAA